MSNLFIVVNMKFTDASRKVQPVKSSRYNNEIDNDDPDLESVSVPAKA